MKSQVARATSAFRDAGRFRGVTRLLVAVWASTTLMVAGCSLPRRTFQPDVDPNKLTDPVFLHYLAIVPVVTVDEGIRAVSLLDEGGGRWTTYEQRYEQLRDGGAIRPGWRLTPARTLDHGTLAYMLRTICRLPYGVGERLASITGIGDRRAALLTSIHEGLLPHRLAHDPVTGGELLSALVRAESYLAERASSASPTQPDAP